MAGLTSGKRDLIDKTNATVVMIVSAAVFLAAFSAVATKTFINQAAYQNRVIEKKRIARDQLKEDIDNAKKLKKSYLSFVDTTKNAIGGDRFGVGQQDGDNAKIVLDALPSSYDFPALPTSIEALVASQNVKISSITGTDDEVAQAQNASSTTPQPIAMPFEFSVVSDYEGVQRVINALERSIRPMKISELDIVSEQKELTLTIKAQTFFQPAKSLNIDKKVVE